MRKRLALRLALLVAFSGVVPLLVLGGSALEIFGRHLEAAVAASLEGDARHFADRLSGFLERQEEALRGLASEVDAAAPGRNLDRLLEEAASRSSAVDAFSILSPADPDGPGQRLCPSLRASLARGEAGVSEVTPDAEGRPHLSYCVPLRARGRALCAEVDLGWPFRMIRSARAGEPGYAVLFGPEGRLLVAGVSAAPAAAPPAGGDLPRLEEASPGRVRARGLGGAVVLAGSARVQRAPWTVVVAEPEREAMAEARLARWALAVAALAALGASLAVGVVASRRTLLELEREAHWRTAGRLAASVVHDLAHRTAILEHTARLADSGDPSELPRIGANLRAEAETLRSFLADFAELARDLRGLERRPVDLGALCQSLVRSAQSRAESAGVRLEASSGTGVWVLGDHHALERAGMNLLVNAIEASSRGGRVDVEAVREGGRSILRVSDDGPGIEPERRRNLFDGFGSTKRSGSHLGIGLPSVKRVAEAHEGRVTLGKAGARTVFALVLPAAEPAG